MSTSKPSVLIIGLGLIGASFGKALKATGSARVLGADQQAEVPKIALASGVIDEAVDQFSNLEQVDVIVLAVPVKAIGAVLKQVKHLIPRAKVLTDVGSVKGAVVKQVEAELGAIPSCFVPGHPIAGAEKSGVKAANPHLFEKHLHILTPLEQSSADAIALISQLWTAVGADVVTMPVDRHDEVLAATSHLPHLLAFSLVDTLARESDNREIFRYAAGGFRDFTRIAASDPTMWHDVFLTNQDATLKILRKFQSDLALLEQAIESSDGDVLKTVFHRSKSARDYFTQVLEQRENGVAFSAITDYTP
ncbi:prephenate dehydrogenase/arogenate dehydrogenase family protein [Reinekea forsetii]|nr:prephenate dehydrogenase/arogenate dehydrogenase family protein [Reinekea forsetii]